MAPLRPAAPVAVVLAALSACSGGGRQLRASDPAQATEDAPNEAFAELERVRVRARLGGWRGDPRDLELRLTPVDVTISNGRDRPLQLGPEAFRLVVAGKPLRVLTQDEVQFAMSSLIGPRRAPPASGRGDTSLPGYDPPDPYARRPTAGPVPALGSWYVPPLPSGELGAGRTGSWVLFFDTPARTLGSATIELELVDTSGTRVGTLRLPYARD
jgi:hypothetical protein